MGNEAQAEVTSRLVEGNVGDDHEVTEPIVGSGQVT